LLLRQLALLTGSGLSLPDALKRLSQYNESASVQAFCRELLEQQDARQHPEDESHLNFMRPLLNVLGGEGVPDEKISQILYEMADVNETTAGFRSAIATAMVYPVKLFLIAVVIWSLMLVFVIPVFDSLFADFGSSLPQATQGLLALSRVFRGNVVYIGILLVAVLFFITQAKRTQRVFLRLFPSLRNLMKKMDVIHFSHLLSIFLAAGLPLKEAVSNAAATMPASAFSPRLEKMGAGLATPMQLTDALKRTGLFPASVLGLTGLAGQVEVLAEIFKNSALYLCRGFDTHLAKAVKAFEMVIFFIVAVVVGGMVIAMYLPIFRLAGAVGG
jgi:type IV pilus assembly protein PilC